MSNALKTFHIIVKGRVQGVGYRATTKHNAEKVGIKGSVKNLSNDDVEIYAQGASDSLDLFVEEIKKSTKLAQVEHVVVEDYDARKEYSCFEILF